MRLRISLRAVFCLGLSLFLSSCGSRRQVSDTSIDSRLISRIETMIDEAMDRRIVDIKTTHLKADTVITKTKSNTGKDVDPATGNSRCPRRQIPISSLAGGIAR